MYFLLLLTDVHVVVIENVFLSAASSKGLESITIATLETPIIVAKVILSFF